MHLSDERIQEMKDLLEKKSAKTITWDEASEAAYNLAGLVDIIFDQYLIDEKRKRKLKESPEGFPLNGDYTCSICGYGARTDDNWYDKWGIKCLTCQKAVDKKIIPGSITKYKHQWYSKYDLESRFNFNHHFIKKLIKNEVLKARIVPNESGRPHAYLFLIKDNKDFLPPKKLTESQGVSWKGEDGKTWFRSEPWYKFHEDALDVIKDYKISNYLQITNPSTNYD